jgi:hypothetical protein
VYDSLSLKSSDAEMGGGFQFQNDAHAALARSFHRWTLTPFTSSHRQSDDSPIKAGRRVAGVIILANAGASSASFLLTGLSKIYRKKGLPTLVCLRLCVKDQRFTQRREEKTKAREGVESSGS